MLSILQVSTSDILGGAEKVSWELWRGYQQRGHRSWLSVGYKHSNDHNILQIPNEAHRSSWARYWVGAGNRLSRFPGNGVALGRVLKLIQRLGDPRRLRSILLGHEDFEYPGTWHLLELPEGRPDIIHCHNLYGNYFDLRALPWLCQQVPVVLTLHDAWLLSGHCAHSLDCERWKLGCGKCPYLRIPPALLRDGSAYNWQRKRAIYSGCRLHVATPSQWLMQKVEQSILAPAIVEARVIPNGVDLTIFRPAERRAARASLDIPLHVKMLLFTGNSIRRNTWKDYQTMRSVVAMVAERLPAQRVRFIALGEYAQAERIGQADIHFIPYQNNLAVVARYYQAADVYLHAAKADTFPMAILEAMACGTPVVATAVGGIPEQIGETRTGFLVAAGDAEAMASRVIKLLSDDALRERMGAQAAQEASRRFDLYRQIDTYLDWYQEILSRSLGMTDAIKTS